MNGPKRLGERQIDASSAAPADALEPATTQSAHPQARITLTAGPDEIDPELAREIISQAGGDPESVTGEQLERIVAAGPGLLRRLADEPAVLVQFMQDPAAVLAAMGIDPIGEPEALPASARVSVASPTHREAVNDLQQDIVQRLARDKAWTAEYRVDPIAAIIELGRGQPATVVAEAIRTLAIPMGTGGSVSPEFRSDSGIDEGRDAP